MPDYSKGKIYTIRCKNDATLIYVGSTIQPLSHRWGGHKLDSIRTYSNSLIYKTINNDWNNWFIELYENYPCENKEELLKREGEIIRLIGNLNTDIPNRTKKEWYEDNADKIKEQKKQYRINNADKIKEKSKQYCIDNADKLKKYRIDNIDKWKEYQKQYQKQYYLKKKQEKDPIHI